MNDWNRRYYLFVISDYYPCGGLNDVDYTSDDLDALVKKGRNVGGDYCYIWDRLQPTDAVWDRDTRPQMSKSYAKRT